ncbi:hypothetical protein TNCV_1051281 [Trichonephila clavipes]|nr:hypothetical protein TNCV_1051281 [Trichonephila clavipes]
MEICCAFCSKPVLFGINDGCVLFRKKPVEWLKANNLRNQTGVMVLRAISYDSKIPLVAILCKLFANSYVILMIQLVTHQFTNSIQEKVFQENNVCPHAFVVTQYAL